MNNNVDYSSMSDNELLSVITGFIDQGMQDDEIQQILSGFKPPEEIEQEEVIWDNWAQTTGGPFETKGQDIEVGGFISSPDSIENPNTRTTKQITIPKHSKSTGDIFNIYTYDDEKNMSSIQGLQGFWDTDRDLANEETQASRKQWRDIDPETARNPEKLKKYLESKGYRKSKTYGSGLEEFEQWKRFEDVPETVVTEDDYINEYAIWEGNNIVGYKNKNNYSFEEYANAWGKTIEEVITPLKNKNITPKDLLATKGFEELGKINMENPEFLDWMGTSTGAEVADTFFNLIKSTGEFANFDEDERNEFFDGGTRILGDGSDDSNRAISERDKGILALFGKEKGTQMIEYLNANPEEYLNMIDSGWVPGETMRNISQSFGEEGKGPSLLGQQFGPDSVERNNTDNFLIQFGIINDTTGTQGGVLESNRGLAQLPVGNDVNDYEMSADYDTWLNSSEGEQMKASRLYQYKKQKVAQFLNDNDIDGIDEWMEYFLGIDPGVGFRRMSTRESGLEDFVAGVPGFSDIGYGSEMIRYSSPENKLIGEENDKIQKDFEAYAKEIGYDGFGSGFGGGIPKLEIGKPITLGNNNKYKARTFQLRPYKMPDKYEEFISGTSELISKAADTEIAKYEVLEKKAAPFFNTINEANETLNYFDTAQEFDPITGYFDLGLMSLPMQDAYNKKNEAIKGLEESGLIEELNKQSIIIKGIEEVNDDFIDQSNKVQAMDLFADASFKNQSEITRMNLAFARTVLEIEMAMNAVGNEASDWWSDETLDVVTNTLGLTDLEKQQAAEGKLDLDGDGKPDKLGTIRPWELALGEKKEKWDDAVAEELPEKIKWSTRLPGQNTLYIQQTLAESAPTLAMVIGPSMLARASQKTVTNLALKNITKRVAAKGAQKGWSAARIAAQQNSILTSQTLRHKIAKKVMNTARWTSAGMFTTTSASAREVDLRYRYNSGETNIRRIEGLLKETPDDAVQDRVQLLDMLNDNMNIQNSTAWDRASDALIYGAVDGLSESLGTLKIINGVRKPMMSWKNLTRPEKLKRVFGSGYLATRAMAVEVTEEIAAQLGHNLADKVIFGDNKSIFEGVDSDLVMDSIVNIMALQAPGYAGNLYRVGRDEIQTFQDKKDQAKRGKRFRELQQELKKVKDPKERRNILNQMHGLMEEANISEFASFQRLRNMSAEQFEELLDIGAKKSKAQSRYLEHMSLYGQALGKGKAAVGEWRDKREELERQLTNLRDQQGNLLNTAQWKRYKNYLKIDKEYQALLDQNKDQTRKGKAKYKELKGSMEDVRSDLMKDFTGKTTKSEYDVFVSPLPAQVRQGRYKQYEVVKDLVMNFGDLLDQNKTEYLTDQYDILMYLAKNEEDLIGLNSNIDDLQNQYGWINKKTGQIVINEPRIMLTLNNNSDSIIAGIAAVTPLHEITHRAINTANIFDENLTEEQLRKVRLAAQGLMTEVEEMGINGTIPKNIVDTIVNRMKSYMLDSKGKVKDVGKIDYSEFLTTYMELMALTGVNIKKWGNLSGMRQVLSDIFKYVGRKTGSKDIGDYSKIINPFTSTPLIKSFLANYLDRVVTYQGMQVGKLDEEKEPTIQEEITKGLKEDGFSFSQAIDKVTTPTEAKELRQLGDQINEAVTQALADRLDKPIEELTKDDWLREGLTDAYMYLIAEEGAGRELLDNTIRQAIRKGKKTVDSKGKVTFTKPITGDNVYGKSMEGFLEDVGMQLYRRTIQRFDPSQNTDFGGFAMSELINFRIGEVLNQYAKDTGAGATGSIETKIGETGDLSMADRLESTEMTPEEYTDQQLALERERKAVVVRQKGKAKKELPKRSAVRQDLSTLKSIDNEVKKQVREELPAVIEEVLKDPKDIKNIDQLVEKIGKKLGERIIKKLGGTIGMKKGEFVVPQEWLDFVKNEYTKLSKGIPGRLIKKSYKDLYNITPTGEKVDVKNVREGKKDSNYRIDRFTIDQPTRTEWVDYFARPEKAKGKPVSVKNKYIARQRGLASIVVREMVKEEMRDYLSNPKNVQAIAEKLNVPVAEVVVEALKDNMLEQFDYDINEQKDNLASVYSFSAAADKTPFTSLSSALGKLSTTNIIIFNQHVPTFLDEVNKIVKKYAKDFPGQELNIGKLELEEAWNKVFTDKFLGKKQKEGVIEGFSTILRFYNPEYIDLDSKELKKQEVTNFLYNEILAEEQDYVLRNILGLNTKSLDSSNQEQLSRAANEVANMIRELLVDGKIDDALALSYFISATWNQSGKVGKGGLTAVYDDTTNQIVYVEDASKVGSVRGSIFQGNKNFAESFLKPLFETYSDVKINVINTTKDKTKKAQYKIEYIKDGVAYDFSDLVDVVPQNVLGYVDGLINGNEIDQRDLKKSEDYAKLNQDFLFTIADYFKKRIEGIEKSKGDQGLYSVLTDLSPQEIEDARAKELASLKNTLGMFLRSANSDMRAPIRAAFRVDSHVELEGIGIDKDFIKKYNKAENKGDKDDLAKEYFRYEHNPPARTTQIGLAEYILGNWNKARVNDMFKTGGISIIPKLMDDQINLFNKDTVPVGVIIGDSTNSIDKFNRYYNSKLYGQFPWSLIYYKKKGKGYERVEYGASQKEAYKQKQDIIKNNNAVIPSNIQPSKSLDNNYLYLERLDNLTKAQANAKKYPVENKGISIFDFDDTVATSKSKVKVTVPAGYKMRGNKRVKWYRTYRINATQFAKQHESLVAQGAEFDFSDFNKVIDGKKGPLFTKLQKAVNKFGNENVFILTARAPQAAPAIKAFLDGLGVDLKIENIIGLADGNPAAKANWVAEKAAQGYNDFYFTDDAYANVQAVQDVLDIVDVKGKTHLAQYQFSQSMDRVFNEMIERKKGIKREAVYSKAKADVQGKSRKDDIFISSDADDFEGLLDRIAGKGKQGDADKAFIKKALHNPFGQAMAALARDRVQLMADYKRLKKDFGINPRELRKRKVAGGFNQEQAVRVYIWNKQGMEIPGLSKTDIKQLVNFIEKNQNLQAYANELIAINKGDQYAPPGFGWLTGTVATDLTDGVNSIKRERYLRDSGWTQNIDIILSEKNLNKLEAAYGKTYREALESFIKRMKTGKSRDYEGDSLTGNFMEWINGSVGAIMFFNTRSAILQTISAANYINWTDNNVMAAGKAFANQKQFWADFVMLYNSEFLVDRRNGLRVNLNESDLAEAAEKGGFMGAVSYILKLGFLPTQIMDSFAIASGGASFYRNRLNTYLKKGLSKQEAHDKTIDDWREIAETSQQSARADKISHQQAGPLGRVILAFANTPMQYTRLMKKAALDLANGRGDWRTNVSKLIYYSVVQNFFFNAIQQALFALGMGDADEDEETEKYANIVNGMADTILRGTGFYGAALAAVKNAIIKYHRESQKSRPKYENAIYELLKFSPPLGSKITKLRNWARSMEWDREEMRTMGFTLDNPAWMAWGQVISAALNIPVDRALRKLENIRDASHTEAEMWQRIALLGGWQAWEIGFDPDRRKASDRGIQYDFDLNLDDFNMDINFDNIKIDF